MKYKWDTIKYGIDADEVGELFEQIIEEKGELSSETVLDEARNEDSKIHRFFEWDDRIAGEQYRRSQALNMINNLTVIIKTKKETPVKAFVKIRTEDKNEYKHIKTVIENTNDYEYLLNKIEKELEALRKRYEALLDITDIQDIIQKVFN